MQKKKKLTVNSETLSKFKKAFFWSFSFCWKTSRKLLVTIICCFAIESVIPVAATGAIGILVGKFKDMGPQEPGGFETLLGWLGIVIVLLTLEFILAEVRNFNRYRLADETSVGLQKELYSHAANMDVVFFEQSSALNKLFRAGSSGGGNGAFGPAQTALSSLSGCVQIVSLFGLMAYLQPLLAVLLFVAGIPLLFIRSLSAVEKYNLEIKTTQKKRLSRYFTTLLTDAESTSAAKILGLAGELIERFETNSRSIILEKIQILKKVSVRLVIAALFYLCVLVSGVVWLTYQFSLGAMEAGAMVAFMMATLRTLRSMTNVSNSLASGADAAFLIVPLIEFLDEKPRQILEGGVSPGKIRGEIVLEDVSFVYPETSKQVISNLSLKISPGEKVAIVGNNGAGKSTLSKLISRLYDIEQGKIIIDGVDSRDLSLRWLHDHIAMVFQKPIQFEATVYENIAFGNWEELHDKPETVKDLAAKVGLLNFIEKLPHGFDTHLGKMFGEVTLSGGQWQLLSVARAMAREDAILILDEPTSNLDMNAEASMFRAIREYAKDRTVLFVSHRFSTVNEADRILVLDEGQLVEDGTHEQLMKINGYYAAMVKHQKESVRV
ncbi:MAG: hypothetical protein C0615_12520 [Desulfuromonas sp.]|nr:MAG: hypothetical protein C0615_12520 [Desulfuromonas sp.]